MQNSKFNSKEQLCRKESQKVKIAAAENHLFKNVLSLFGLLGVVLFLATLIFITGSAHGESEIPKSECFAGQYLLHRSASPAKQSKALSIVSSLSQDQVQLREETKKVMLVEEKIYSGDFSAEDSQITDCSFDNLCSKLRKQQRSLRKVNKQQEEFSIVRRLECNPNYVLRTMGKTPNDTYYSLQWGFEQEENDIDLDLSAAWDLSTGSSNVVVAVIDSGIDYNHEDIKDNMWVNPNEIAGNDLDDDNNGYIDDVYGVNTLADSGDPWDDSESGHGTHCAGTIGAVGNNEKGVAGVNWNIKMIAVKFTNTKGVGSTLDAIQGIEYITALKNSGVNLILSNNSWGDWNSSSLLETAIQDNKNTGMLFVAAAGNFSANNDSTPFYPASYSVDNIISVAALDSDGSLASYSHYGANSVHIAAPGTSIASTVPSAAGQYAYMSGTSMAAPHISGLLALLAAYSPGLSYSTMKSRLLSTAEPMNNLTGYVQAGGMANAYNLLDNAQPGASPTPSPTAGPTASPTATPGGGGGAVPTATPTSTPGTNPVLSGMLTSKKGSALSGRTLRKIRRLAKRNRIKLVLTSEGGGKTRSSLTRSLTYEVEVASGDYILSLKVPRTKVRVFLPKKLSVAATESVSGLNFKVKLK